MDSFLNAVYMAELGRSIDPTGSAYWPTVTVNDPVGRATTVARIMRSTEGEQDEITGIYQLTLGRLPDSVGLASWTAALQQGEGDLNVIARIVGSNEYFDDLQAFAATGSDPNAAAHRGWHQGRAHNLPAVRSLSGRAGPESQPEFGARKW